MARTSKGATAPPPAKPQEKRVIKVFIASPGDLAPERRAFKDRIDQLNAGFGDGAGVEFVGLGWEDTLATTGRRVQSVINQDVDACDVFVLAMHRRWGQQAPDSAYGSYTEEEFHRALERFEKTTMPEIFVFFKDVDAASMSDPGPELQKVLKFRLELERARTVRFRTFPDTNEFGREIDRHLRAFVKGELPAVTSAASRLPLPIHLVERVERAEAEARRVAEDAEARARKESDRAEAAIQEAASKEARARALENLVAIESAHAASEGSIEAARQRFAAVTQGTTNPHVLFLAFEFYWRAGPLSAAQEVLERWLALKAHEGPAADTAEALGKLGLIYHTRGELDRAEPVLREALAVGERLGRAELISTQCSSLGLLCQTRGDLDAAEKLHRRALTLETKLARPDGISNAHTSLGLVSHTRGELDRAEEFHRRALAAIAPSAELVPHTVLTIPVVVHVVYHTASENISDAQISSQLVALNADFRARNDDLWKVPYAFKPLIGDTRIQFQLATVDPGGAATTGITRTKTSRTGFGADDAVKSGRTGGADPWDPGRYFNIWVCTLVPGMQGYGQFPGGDEATEGAVINSKAFGTEGTVTAPFNRGRVTTHTIGHCFNLTHIWYSDAKALGDPVGDIPIQQSPNFGTPSFPHISGNNGPHGDMFMNFMDYVDDAAMHMFTKRQVLRMHAALQGPLRRLGTRDSGSNGDTPARRRLSRRKREPV